ncbi:MAG TPA: sialidase family protein [Phycisphaerae bacterium]|nr:sialidase family protein [Phycisphaerae bacterium]
MRKIWDKAPHNAFTDLVRFQDRFFCTFRESDSHAQGQDGKVRVLASADGDQWTSAALLAEEGIDLRDPKLSVMPDGRLMLLAGGSVYQGKTFLTRRPRVAFSKNGRDWTSTQPILAEDHWLWRVTWHKGRAYGVSKTGPSGTCGRDFLYTSTDGLNWDWVAQFRVTGADEATLRFGPDDEMIALVRCETGNGHAWVGTSRPPYKDWLWNQTGLRLGGPELIRLPDGRYVAGGRLYEDTLLPQPTGKPRTSLCWLDPHKGTMTEFLALPSGGDTSYPGMVWHDDMLWVSYYSAHEGTTSRDAAIYLARIRFDKRKQ